MEDNYKHRGLRKKLVSTVQGKGITDDHVLQALGAVPRHYFFPPEFLEHAYVDKAFPIGEGQTISQPYTVAFQTELLHLKKGDKILEIGTGSGYQCIILELMGAEVYSIEYNPVLYQKAKKLLRKLGCKAQLFQGDGSKGLPRMAPFDGILVTAGAPTVPKALIDQLAIGGRLVIPVGNRKSQQMLKLTKLGDKKLQKEVFANFKFVPLVGKEGWG